jgi:hypothetical protein
MLSLIDKYQSVLVSVLLISYIINSIYIGSSILTVILLIFVVAVQIIRLRKHIQKLSFAHLLMIFATLVVGLAGLVLVIMWLNHIVKIGMVSLPDWTISVIQITLILVFLLSVTAIVQKLFVRFTLSKT